jgi:glycosyltransferase involved in cell wall biosynthesis
MNGAASDVLIDVMRLVFRRSLGTIPTGIDRVGLEYIRHYAPRARAVLSLGPLAAPLSREDSTRLFGELLRERTAPGFTLLATRLAAKNTAWNWIRPGAGTSFLLNTSELWLNSRHYATQLRWLGARPVFFIHDLIPVMHPEYFTPGDDAAYHGRLRVALEIARGIVVNSEQTRADLERYAAERHFRCPPLAVAPLAPSVLPAERTARPVSQPYFVMLGTIEPRKNHLLVLHLWRSLIERLGDAAPRLFVVGQRGWECENVVDLLERCAPLRGFVFERGRCSDAEVASILHHAQALLMPTFAEGFGLPVVEALAAGVPVVASDLPVFREIAGTVPEYADPLDGARWTALVEDYMRDGPLRRAQLERMKGFRAGTWARHFEIVDRFLESLP